MARLLLPFGSSSPTTAAAAVSLINNSTTHTFIIARNLPSTTPCNHSRPILLCSQLSKPPSPRSDTPKNGLLTPEDVAYLAKLSLGCLVGGAVIKYGSVLVPAITKPNLVQALSMISFPIVLGVALLIAVSITQAKKRNR